MGEPRRGLAGLAVFAGIVLALFSAESTLISARITFDLGTPGTYVFDKEPSFGGRKPAPCYSYSGTFTSDDGTVKRTGMSLAGSFGRGFAKGHSVRAFDVGYQKTVYSPETRNGNTEAPIHFSLTAGGLVAAVFGIFYLWYYRNHD